MAELAEEVEMDDAEQHKHSIAAGYKAAHPIHHKKYGNLLVFLDSKMLLLSLGPNYICFLVTFACFCILGYFLVNYVNQAADSEFFKTINLIIVSVQLLTYLVTALSNPGVVVTEYVSANVSEQENKRQICGGCRFCKKCNMNMMKRTYHCRSCDVCIQDYDHHCPWTSKCIGGKNLKTFYFFIGYTPLYIIYCMITFLFCIANNALKMAMTAPKQY